MRPSRLPGPLTGLISTSFAFQTTDPATNQLVGSPNTAIDIPALGHQTFVVALGPNAPVPPTELQFKFDCANTDAAPIIPGVNTLLFSASATPVPDIVAVAATIGNTGIVDASGANLLGAFAVASVNLGAGGPITVSVDTGRVVLPVSLSVCETNPLTGACTSAPASTTTTTINGGGTPTFSIFVAATGAVPFDPARNRVFVHFKDAGGVARGSTSVAVRTQ